MPVKRTRDVFRAISDPTRRFIIELLSEKEMSIAEIQKHFNISGPAIFEQMKILGECRLLKITRRENKKYYKINIKSLLPLTAWLKKLEHVRNY